MMKIFLDTNILLDILYEREAFVQDALAIFDLAADGELTVCVSDLTIANIKYITRKDYTTDEFCDAMKALRPILQIEPLGADVIDEALQMRASDFEDSLQYLCAVKAHADCIIIRNIKDFGFAQIEVISPRDFLQYFNFT